MQRERKVKKESREGQVPKRDEKRKKVGWARFQRERKVKKESRGWSGSKERGKKKESRGGQVPKREKSKERK